MVVYEKKFGQLNGWKAIAQYCECSIETAKKRCKSGMPVRKPPSGGVVALPYEIDQWIKKCPIVKV